MGSIYIHALNIVIGILLYVYRIFLHILSLLHSLIQTASDLPSPDKRDCVRIVEDFSPDKWETTILMEWPSTNTQYGNAETIQKQ